MLGITETLDKTAVEEQLAKQEAVRRRKLPIMSTRTGPPVLRMHSLTLIRAALHWYR